MRAEGLEPTSSFEHRHLKPACLPFHHARSVVNRTAEKPVAARRAARYRRGVSTTRRRRPALVALVTIAALTCLALAWWQWERFQSVNGTGQNLGYALQWPLFAAFFVYAYRKFVRYEEEPPETTKPGVVTEIPAGLLPERPKVAASPPDDPALAEYNAYLAELAKADRQQDRRTIA